MTVRPATPDELADWDERTVDPPGGHVYQSRAWAAHRAASGWTPHHLIVDDDVRGSRPDEAVAVHRRGQRLHPARSDRRRRSSRLTVPPASWPSPTTSPSAGIDVVAVGRGDSRRQRLRGPDLAPPASTRSRRSSRRATGSRCRSTASTRTPRSRGSRSRPGSGSGRPRRTASTSSATTRALAPGGVGEGFAAPARADRRRARSLLRPPARDRRAASSSRSGRANRSSAGGGPPIGRATSSTSRLRAPEGAPLAGLLLYRHGERLSTVHSGDHADGPTRPPGRPPPAPLAGDPARDPRAALARWTWAGRMSPAPGASRARASRCTACTSTSCRSVASWLELTGAHETVIRPNRYRAGRIAARARPHRRSRAAGRER